MSRDARVTRSSFSRRLQPISVPHPMSVLPGRIWSDDDWERIQRGFAARDMEDRWDVLTENNVVFLYRSWSGFGVFEATFAPVDGGWRIAEAVVERDQDRYRNTGDRDDCLMLESVISVILLGERSPSSKRSERRRQVERRAPAVREL
jgi:hypothetical protein